MQDPKGNCWVFQWRDKKLKTWQGKMGLRDLLMSQVKFGDRLGLYGYQGRFVWLFLPRIWLEGRELRWQFGEEVSLWFTVFALLPRGKQALFSFSLAHSGGTFSPYVCR
ncbi:MAG: hypothetical protein LKKZDAJK_001429 [Candidatus Fervidibacter sp.]